MRFTQYDLGFQETGSVVEVALSGTEANVQLLDSTALTNYKARRSYQYVGGHYRQSPVRLSVPHAGVWYVIVDLGRYVGKVRSAVRVISPLTMP